MGPARDAEGAQAVPQRGVPRARGLRERPLAQLGVGAQPRAGVCAAYLVMFVVVHLLTRRLFAVPFERARIAKSVAIVGALTIAGELLLPTTGVAGFAARAAVLAAIPVALLLARAFTAAEITSLRRSLRSG